MTFGEWLFAFVLGWCACTLVMTALIGFFPRFFRFLDREKNGEE